MKNLDTYHVCAAIRVKYLGPTDHKGARYKAISQAGNLTANQDYGLGPAANAYRTAHELADSLGWLEGGRDLNGGCLPCGDYVFTIGSIEQ